MTSRINVGAGGLPGDFEGTQFMTDIALRATAELKAALRARIAEMGDMHIPVTVGECDALFLFEAPYEDREIDAAALETILALLDAKEAAEKERACPIPMLLWCPKCNAQHIDEPSEGWDNPPHRSHLCHACGCIWRPADVATTGVEDIKTAGDADTWGWSGGDSLLLSLGVRLAAAEQRAVTAYAEGLEQAAWIAWTETHVEWAASEKAADVTAKRVCRERRKQWGDDDCDRDGSCAECAHDVALAHETSISRVRRQTAERIHAAIRAAIPENRPSADTGGEVGA